MYSIEQILISLSSYIEDYFRDYDYNWELGVYSNTCCEQVKAEFEIGEVTVLGTFYVYGTMHLDRGDYFMPPSSYGEVTVECDMLKCFDGETDEPLIVTEREYLDQLKQNIIL